MSLIMRLKFFKVSVVKSYEVKIEILRQTRNINNLSRLFNLKGLREGAWLLFQI